jgi:hypothetical protein
MQHALQSLLISKVYETLDASTTSASFMGVATTLRNPVYNQVAIGVSGKVEWKLLSGNEGD